jgi:hypothetical protein
MAHSYHHALSSARKWGGKPEDYRFVHDFLDSSKSIIADFRHRAMFHHASGIFMAEQLYGAVLSNSAGRIVPVRMIGEQHVLEDLGRIPSFADWVRAIRPEPWMGRVGNLRADDSGTPERDHGTIAGEVDA